jgi:predicted CoA-binding protein
MDRDSYTDEEIKQIFSLKNVAVIGLSKNQEKAAHFVPKYLSQNGYNIIPVNPTADEILDKKCYWQKSLQERKESKWSLTGVC